MKRHLIPLAAAALLAPPLAACGESAVGNDAADGEYPDPITLAAVPAEDSTDLEASYDPVIKLLEEETGSEVEFVQASDYAGVVEGLIADKVDIAFLGSFGYVIATENDADITPLGAVTPEKGLPPGYRSYGLTQPDNTEIDSLQDFAGKDVCFVDPGSTSGFLYPTAGLIDAGVIASSEESDLSTGLNPIFAGGHDASALAVASGDCDAGFAMQSMVDETLIKSGDLNEGDLKKVWESPMISGSLFVGSNDLGTEIIDELTSILTTKANADYLRQQGFCEGDCLITDEDAWGVEPAQDSDYDGVRQVCEVTKSDECEG
jgi:phosphonate transport system substrate-binding protein